MTEQEREKYIKRVIAEYNRKNKTTVDFICEHPTDIYRLRIGTKPYRYVGFRREELEGMTQPEIKKFIMDKLK